jgi:hypothetical protein
MPSSKTPVFYVQTLHLVCERQPSGPLSGICHREYLSGFAPDLWAPTFITRHSELMSVV